MLRNRDSCRPHHQIGIVRCLSSKILVDHLSLPLRNSWVLRVPPGNNWINPHLSRNLRAQRKCPWQSSHMLGRPWKRRRNGIPRLKLSMMMKITSICNHNTKNTPQMSSTRIICIRFLRIKLILQTSITNLKINFRMTMVRAILIGWRLNFQEVLHLDQASQLASKWLIVLRIPRNREGLKTQEKPRAILTSEIKTLK